MTEERESRPTQSSSQGRPPTRSGPPRSGPSRSGPPRRDYNRGRGGPGGARGRFTRRAKVCSFCLEKKKEIDYKDLGTLRRSLTELGKIKSRRKTGACAKHQRRLSIAVKRARYLALLPVTSEHIRRY